ncbi:unnamed protein product [Rotaria sp. Silwood1]|nr:unnamed protein product [Rotaria sp. Silwood1]
MYDSGVQNIGEYTMIFSGQSSINKTRNAHGVAVCLNKQATMAWHNSGSVWEAVSERILMVRLATSPVNVTIIAIYSPVNPNGQQHGAEAVEIFYEDLQRIADKVSPHDLLLLMGDFNARVGKQQHQTSGNIVGPHAVDRITENGERLIDFCTVNNLVISNTFFEHKSIHKMTWMHPRNKKWHMIDYIIVNKKFRSSIEDVRVQRAAAAAVGTDHHLIRAKLRFHLKSRKKLNQRRPSRLDRKKMQDIHRVEHFQQELERRPTTTSSNTMSINDKYSEFVEYVKKVSVDIFQQHGNGIQRKEWLTDEIIEAVEKKANAFIQWQNHRGSRAEQRYLQKYRLLRTLVKKKIQDRQVQYWDERSQDIETAMKKNDPATAYRLIRQLKGRCANIEHHPVQDTNGQLLISSTARLTRWKEYFQDLLNVPTKVNPLIIQQITPAIIPSHEELRQSMTPSLIEVEQAINKMKSGRAPGIDEISADILKVGGPPMVKWLHEFFVDIWNNEEMIDDWTTAILIRLHKNKGSKAICDNYRGISLLTATSKVFSRIILNRVSSVLDKRLLEEQAGFRPKRSTIDQIFTLQMVMEKTHELNKPMHMCFIDIRKAYDSIHRPLLWQICSHYGISNKIIRMLQLMYTNTKGQVRINGELSPSFQIETGVLQGGIYSPILFNVFFDFVIRRVIEKAGILGIKGIELAYGSNDFFHPDSEGYVTFNILVLMYADDLVVMCSNKADLKKFMYLFEEVTQECGLIMNISKTCIMSLQQYEQDGTRRVIKNIEVDNTNIDINIRNEKINVVTEFSYLGCHVTQDQTIQKEIETRILKASKAFNALRNIIWYRKTISIPAKLRIFRACVIPVLLYGSETWSTTIVQERRLNVFYLKCLRTIIGINLGDRMSNDKILQLTGQPEISELIRRNRLRWFGHVNRMENADSKTSIVKKCMYSYYPKSKRPRGIGNRKTWSDKIMDDITKCGIRNWRKETMNRDKWRKTINKNAYINPPASNIINVIQDYKQRAAERRAEANMKQPRWRKNSNINILFIPSIKERKQMEVELETKVVLKCIKQGNVM